MSLVLVLATTLALSLASISPNSRIRPALLHNIAWLGGLTVVLSGVMGYDPLASAALWMIFSSILGFNAGVLFASETIPDFQIRQEWRLVGIKRKHFYCLVAIYATGLVGYLLTISRIFGLEVLLRDPRSIRAADNVNYLAEFPLAFKLMFYVGPLVMVLCMFPQYVSGLRETRLRWLILAIVAGTQLLALQRTNLFVGLIWALGLFVIGVAPARGRPKLLKGRRRMVARRAVYLFTLACVAFAAFQGIASVLGKQGNDNVALSSSANPAIAQSSLAGPLFYFTSGIPAFGKLTQSNNTARPPATKNGAIFGDYNPHTHGTATFSGISRVLPEEYNWNDVAPFTHIPQLTNVYTWLEPWYRDFRSGGVIAASVAMGLVISAAVRQRWKNAFWQLAAGLLVGMTILCTFVNRFGMVFSFVLYIALVILAALNPRATEARSDAAEPRPRQPLGRPHF